MNNIKGNILGRTKLKHELFNCQFFKANISSRREKEQEQRETRKKELIGKTGPQIADHFYNMYYNVCITILVLFLLYSL